MMTPRLNHGERLLAAVCLTALGLSAVDVWLSPSSDSSGMPQPARVHAQAGAPKAAADAENSHGALAMDKQLERLATMLGDAKAVTVPAGMSPAFFATLVPKESAGTVAQVALGRKLYFEKRLSRDGTVACATCHDVSRGFTDQRPLFEGVGGKVGRRNSPTTLNALFFHSQFWDGRARTLEDQAKLPIVNPIEMGQPSAEAAVASIAGDQGYQREFQAAFGRAVNYEDIASALASFERTLVFLDAPFDRFLAGDPKAISAEAREGWALFNGKARCTACHQLNGSSPIGTDNRFHNIGVSARHQDFEALAKKALQVLASDDSSERQDKLAIETDLSELGRFVVTKNRADVGAFKTEQIRNVGISPPYMHDGSLATLWDVMDHYNKGGEANPYLDGGIEPLALSEAEIDRVVAFLFALTDDRLREQNEAEMKRQRQLASGKRPFRDDSLASRKVYPFERRLQTGR
jgi:cytochrome c peroxidase